MADNALKRIDTLSECNLSQEKMLEIYSQWSVSYDKEAAGLKYNGCIEVAKAVMKYCLGKPENVKILDVATGTGLIGEELTKLGFKNIDGVDPSLEMTDKAKSKGVYKNMFLEYFTKDPMGIPADTYEVIVTCGSMMENHLPYDCLYEMVRLVKPGGRVCFAARANSFDRKTEYGRNLLSLMDELELNKRWKKLEWKNLQDYRIGSEGCLVVYEIC